MKKRIIIILLVISMIQDSYLAYEVKATEDSNKTTFVGAESVSYKYYMTIGTKDPNETYYLAIYKRYDQVTKTSPIYKIEKVRYVDDQIETIFYPDGTEESFELEPVSQELIDSYCEEYGYVMKTEAEKLTDSLYMKNISLFAYQLNGIQGSYNLIEQSTFKNMLELITPYPEFFDEIDYARSTALTILFSNNLCYVHSKVSEYTYMRVLYFPYKYNNDDGNTDHGVRMKVTEDGVVTNLWVFKSDIYTLEEQFEYAAVVCSRYYAKVNPSPIFKDGFDTNGLKVE